MEYRTYHIAELLPEVVDRLSGRGLPPDAPSEASYLHVRLSQAAPAAPRPHASMPAPGRDRRRRPALDP